MNDKSIIVLAGDVGGTKTLLALFECRDSCLVELKSKKYKSHDFANLEMVVKDFLNHQKIKPQIAVFGIPGPVENGKAKSTNLPWAVDEKNLIKQTKIPTVKIINDLVSTAYDVPYLKPEEIIQIKDGACNNSGTLVVIAPGTGLGQAFLISEGNKKIIIPSEGGHADFAPTNEIEVELYLFLYKKFKHVSLERIISGNGLLNIFDYLVQSKFAKPKSETIEKMKIKDKAAVITDMAIDKKDIVCDKALEIFVSALGAHAGNLVITLLATGGVYLGGGIPYKILPKLMDKTFENSFTRKGRLEDIVEATPVYVINNNNAALHGAARFAVDLYKGN